MWDKFYEAILVSVVGLSGVIGSLVFFYLVISFINKMELIFVNYQKDKANREFEKAQPSKAAQADIDEDEDELTAVITAAVVAATNKEIVIKRIKFLQQSSSNSWATIGRMGLIASHNIQKTSQ